MLAAVALAAVGGLGSTAAIAATGHTGSRPALRLVDTSPVTFLGAGFKPGERVRVTFVGTTRDTRQTVASARGAFVIRLPGVDGTACTGFSATAVGNHGSRATFKRAPGQCPAP